LNEYVRILRTHSIVIGKEKIEAWLPVIVGTLHFVWLMGLLKCIS